MIKGLRRENSHAPGSRILKTKIQKILVLSWRDIKNPASGGAELLTHEIAKRLVKKGHNIVLFCANFKDGKISETIDGVKFIRKGHWRSVHIFAFFYYLKNHKDIDVIIDEIHWFPFFTGVYARKKTIALTCEVANKLFFTIFPYPIAIFFRAIEKIYLYLYRSIPTMTISESTKKDLIKEGINKDLITVLPMGLNFPKNLKKYPKEKNPTFIYLARLNKQKGIFDAIEAFALIKEQRTKIKDPALWIVGSGEEDVVVEVKKRVKEKNLGSNIKFFGFVTEEKKFELLSRAHILLIPSVHEGWGLTVIEACHVGTPSVGYNVEGLKDTIIHNKTGLLTNSDPDSLAKETLQLFNNKVQCKNLSTQAKIWSKKFSWDACTKKSLDILNKFINK